MLSESFENSMCYVIHVARIPSGILAQDKGLAKILQQAKTPHETSLNGEWRNSWLFQSNPVLYDVRGALQALKEQVWSVTRFAKEIKTGDRVYIWEAGQRGGIVGLGEISEPARLQSEPPEQLPFARVPETFAGDRFRVRLRILRSIEPVIGRQSIVSRQDLASLGVLRCSRGTNFRLSQQEVKILQGLVESSGAS